MRAVYLCLLTGLLIFQETPLQHLALLFLERINLQLLVMMMFVVDILFSQRLLYHVLRVNMNVQNGLHVRKEQVDDSITMVEVLVPITLPLVTICREKV